MSRYIDADALIMPLFESSIDETWMRVALDSAPSIDIVRCKECKWRKEDNSCDLNCRIEYLDGTETDMWFYVNDDDFCSYGERSDE